MRPCCVKSAMACRPSLSAPDWILTGARWCRAPGFRNSLASRPTRNDMSDGLMKVAHRVNDPEVKPQIRGILLAGISLFMALALVAGPSEAQDQPPAPLQPMVPAIEGIPPSLMPPAPAATENEGTATGTRQADNPALLSIAEAKKFIRDATVLPESLQTLFFTAWQ